MLLPVLSQSSGCCYLCLSVGVAAVGKMGVHLSADSSGILRVDKAESVIEVWEEYEVDVPVETLQENVTIEARQTPEGGSETDAEVCSSPCMVQQSYCMVQQSYCMVQQSYCMVQQSYCMAQQSYCMVQQSYCMAQQSYCMAQQSDCMVQQSYCMVQQSDSEHSINH